MSDNDFVDQEVIQDELAALKVRADLMGLAYHPSIGLEKLRAKVEGALSDTPDKVEDVVESAIATLPHVESPDQFRGRKLKEAAELVRIRLSCMNPDKKDWAGEIITTGNAVVGTFAKYVPFNAEDGWHVPRIIYDQLVERKCQIFVSTRDSKGNTTRKGKLIREFAIEVLEPLTMEELKDLAQRQALANAID
jgi:hypothetical protein